MYTYTWKGSSSNLFPHDLLCDLGEVTVPLWTLVSSVKWEVNKISGLKLGSKEVSRGLGPALPGHPLLHVSYLPFRGCGKWGQLLARPLKSPEPPLPADRSRRWGQLTFSCSQLCSVVWYQETVSLKHIPAFSLVIWLQVEAQANERL